MQCSPSHGVPKLRSFPCKGRLLSMSQRPPSPFPPGAICNSRPGHGDSLPGGEHCGDCSLQHLAWPALFPPSPGKRHSPRYRDLKCLKQEPGLRPTNCSAPGIAVLRPGALCQQVGWAATSNMAPLRIQRAYPSPVQDAEVSNNSPHFLCLSKEVYLPTCPTMISNTVSVRRTCS